MLGISYAASEFIGIEFSKIKNLTSYSFTGEVLLFMGLFISTAI